MSRRRRHRGQLARPLRRSQREFPGGDLAGDALIAQDRAAEQGTGDRRRRLLLLLGYVRGRGRDVQHDLLHLAVVRLGATQVRFLATVDELAKPAEQVRRPQTHEAGDQLGDEGGERGRNAEHEGQADGQVNDR